MKRKTALLYVLIGILLVGLCFVAKNRIARRNITIVPGVRVGEFKLGMSKDDVLKKLGKPTDVFWGGAKYTLDNLPKRYYMLFGNDLSFFIDDDSVKGITVCGPPYKFANGLGVGISQDQIKQAFGNVQLDEQGSLVYKEKGLGFGFSKEDGTANQISVIPKVIMLSAQPPGPITFPKIDRRPKPYRWAWGEMISLPKYDPNSDNPSQADLRGRDLSMLDLRNSIENLMYADFDDRTVWPANDMTPNGFNWQKLMELGKNPGLGVRTLHDRGITGKGVGVAIIDQPLLTEHQEYADRLRLYEENNIRDRDAASMHGAVVASIAVGKTVGVVPDADLYYIATRDMSRDGDRQYNFVFSAQAIQRILEINRQLPAGRKIRVVSMSIGWSPSQKGYDEITTACEEAKAEGIFIVSRCIDQVYGFQFQGLGRQPLADPDLFESYEPGLWWARDFYESAPSEEPDHLLVPMDSRTTASFTGGDEYAFYRQGRASSCPPYIAGVYALAAQVKPEITPEKFWDLAVKTGRTIELEHEGEKRPFGPIIDPVALIGTLQKG